MIVDLVPNHTSDEHVWFKEALASAPGSRERRRYMFHPGRGDGSLPPNNWTSIFGGSAWTRLPDGEWYLHLFDASQPDLNWRNEEVLDEFDSILRFWLDRGVDGFRIDVAHGMIKDEALPDRAPGGSFHVAPFWDQPGVHSIYRRWHQVLPAYDGDRMAIAEAWADDEAKMAQYLRHDELQQAFNFHWLEAQWSAAEFRRVIERTFAAVDPVEASPTWVLSNHDVEREVTRYGGGEQGLARSRAATLDHARVAGVGLHLPGRRARAAAGRRTGEDRQDPVWFRGGGIGRDGCRVPIPWSGSKRPFGFSPDGSAEALAAAAGIMARAERRGSGGGPRLDPELLPRGHSPNGGRSSPGLEQAIQLAACNPRRAGARPGARLHVCAQLQQARCPPPSAGGVSGRAADGFGELLISSGDDAAVASGVLPPDTASWFSADPSTSAR